MYLLCLILSLADFVNSHELNRLIYNLYTVLQVTSDPSIGCQVLSEGVCPRQRYAGIDWPRTEYNKRQKMPCPTSAEGSAVRTCHREDGWLEPDLSGCIGKSFVKVAKTVEEIHSNNIQLDEYWSVLKASLHWPTKKA